MKHGRVNRVRVAPALATLLFASMAALERPSFAQVVIDMPPPRPAIVMQDADAKRDTVAKPQAVGGAQAIEPGALAMSRYARGRTFARPNDPYERAWLGYGPRGRGIGPWGLGHHWWWYGDFCTVSPIFFKGRTFKGRTLRVRSTHPWRFVDW
jgi:hypothetical protein